MHINQPRLRYDTKGRYVWVFPDGARLPYIAGGDGPTATLTADQLVERRTAILAELENPDTPADRVAELAAEGESVAAQIEAANTAAETARSTRARLLGAVPAPTQTPGAPSGGGSLTPGEDAAFQDIAQRFVESAQLAQFRANGFKGKVGLDLPGVEMRSILQGHEVRVPIDSTATSAGAFQNPSRPAVVPMTNADRPVRLADLIDRQNTGDNTVEYVRDTTAAGSGAAAETAEGANKPEAGYTFEVVTDSVRTVAHWVQITRQAADDNQQIMGYIRGRLRYGLEYRLDGQIINGNGTSPNLRGVLNTSGINLYAPGVAEARVISIRKGITSVQVDEYSATTVVLNPADWELVELSTDTAGMFRVSPNVANALAPRIWGLNVVSTTAIASGVGLVGDFRMGATLWDRQQPQLYMTDSHASTFIANVLTLLAELRAALSVWRPSAFCKITFNGTI